MRPVSSRKRNRVEPNSNREAILNCFLHEYNSLTNEIRIRLGFSHKILNIFIVVIGAILAAFIQIIFVSQGKNSSSFDFVVFMSPLLTGPLSAFYIDNLMMIYKIGNYLNSYLFVEIRFLLKKDSLFWWEDYHKISSIKLFYVCLAKNVFFLLILTFPFFYYVPKKVGIDLTDFLINFMATLNGFFSICDNLETIIFTINSFFILVVFGLSVLNIMIFLRNKNFVVIGKKNRVR